MKLYTLIDHTADLGMEVTGRTRRELFANAAYALLDIMIERRQKPVMDSTLREMNLSVEGSDAADLLVNFLREILYLFNGKRQVVVSCMIIRFAATGLIARLVLEPYSPKKHTIKTELKAVTYHGLSVDKIKNGWKARVIFDV